MSQALIIVAAKIKKIVNGENGLYPTVPSFNIFIIFAN